MVCFHKCPRTSCMCPTRGSRGRQLDAVTEHRYHFHGGKGRSRITPKLARVERSQSTSADVAPASDEWVGRESGG